MNQTEHPAIASMEELHEFNQASFKDLWACYENVQKAGPNTMFWRRTTLRIFAAHVEGIVYLMKQIVLHAAPVLKVNFSAGEMAFLKEVSFEMEENGKIKEKGGKFPKFVSNLQFTCECFCRVNHCKIALNYEDEGFRHFKTMVKIRDRLMHPKSRNSLIISDDEAESAFKAFQWFRKHFDLVFQESSKSFKEYVKVKEAEIKMLSGNI